MIEVIDQLALKLKVGIGLRIEELKEVLRRKRDEIASYKAGVKKKEPEIKHSVEDDDSLDYNGRVRFIRYCLSLIGRTHPQHHKLLVLILKGLNHKKIT